MAQWLECHAVNQAQITLPPREGPAAGQDVHGAVAVVAIVFTVVILLGFFAVISSPAHFGITNWYAGIGLVLTTSMIVGAVLFITAKLCDKKSGVVAQTNGDREPVLQPSPVLEEDEVQSIQARS